MDLYLVPGLLLYFIFRFTWMSTFYSHNLLKISTIFFHYYSYFTEEESEV